ncbi:unnamed protein product [Durusdinium trenchii]|uniref:Uncharacterized protein n=1 Tax=Durusdinium trenchii TaxID=1381693 RepID=A0ABP0M697_9DINO
MAHAAAEAPGTTAAWERLLACVARADVLEELPASGLADLLWAFARLSCRERHRTVRLVTSSLMTGAGATGELDDQGLVNTVWALAKLFVEDAAPHVEALALMVRSRTSRLRL